MRSSAPKLSKTVSSRLPKFSFKKIDVPASFAAMASQDASGLVTASGTGPLPPSAREEDRGSMAASTTNFVRMDTWGGNNVSETEMHGITTETMFQEYEREARMLFEKVQEELYAVEAGAPSDKADSMLDEISQNRRALQMRIRTDRSLRSRWSHMLEEWDAQISELRGALNTFHERSRRSELCDARRQAAMQIKNSEDKLEEGSHLLENAHREILETENIGSKITRDLASQREVILHARSNLAVVGNELQTASSIIKDIFNANRIRRFAGYIATGIVALLSFALFCNFGWPSGIAANLPSAITATANATYVPLQQLPRTRAAPQGDTKHSDNGHDAPKPPIPPHDATGPVEHIQQPSLATAVTAVTSSTASEDVPLAHEREFSKPDHP